MTAGTVRASERLQGVLGLAARAGAVRVGFDAVRHATRSGGAHHVLVARDAPASVSRRLAALLRSEGTPCKVVVLDGNQLGHAVGRGRVIALAVTDRSLAGRVAQLAEEVEAADRRI